MIKRLTLYCLTISILLGTVALAQDEEIYFKFQIEYRNEISRLTKLISIDNVKGDTVYAYANRNQMAAFEKLAYSYIKLPHPGTLIVPEMSATKDAMGTWDTYPTYGAYVSMMNQFAADHPGLCVVVDAGLTPQGKSLLFARISDNVSTEENEPEVMYTSSMHGDETAGYVLMLRLMDFLLTNYGSDPLVTRLVDSCEIWINPLANPDGTYHYSDSSVIGSIRGNSNIIDLNRNFPDPQDGDHPDGNVWQTETILMMDFADLHNFVLSANFHGGAEVVNYPWDTWSNVHADESWYFDICREFADTVHQYCASGYMDDLNNGITNGYDWYEVNGGRQDYMNWWHGCREITIELSTTKLPAGSQLPVLWNYNRASFLYYLENSLHGISGIVTDSATEQPLAATVRVLNLDVDNSEVFTDPDVGDYHRMILPGTYDLEFSAPGHFSRTRNSVTVSNGIATVLNVALPALPNSPIVTVEDFTGNPAGPGDTVSMMITLRNSGGDAAVNAIGSLSTSDPFITILQNSSAYPTLVSDGGSGVSYSGYQFTILPMSPNYRDIPLHLAVTADGGFSTEIDFNFFVGGKNRIFYEDFALEQGWTGLGGPGQWTTGPAGGGTGGQGGNDPLYDNSPGSDNFLMGNNLDPSNGAYSNLLGSTYWIISPIIDCSNFTAVQLSFYRWLGIEEATYDHAYVQVNSGLSWVTIFENGATIDDLSWKTMSYDISDFADHNPSLRIRFGIGSTDNYGQYCGWNIDDLELRGYGEISTEISHIEVSPVSLNRTLHVGDLAVDTLIVYDRGEALLRTRFSSAENWLEFNEEQYIISAGDSLLFPVTINAAAKTPGDYAGHVCFISNDPEMPEDSIPVNLTVEPAFICGDADAGGGVNILDVAFVINYLYKDGMQPDAPESADVNNSGSINILDVGRMIGFLYKGGSELQCP